MSSPRRIPSAKSHAQPRLVALCDAQHGVAEHTQIVGLGLGARGIHHRVEAQTLFEVYRSVYALSRTLTEDGRRKAATLAVGATAELTAWSAAEIYDVAERPDDDHHVVHRGPKREIPGLVVYRTRLVLPVTMVRDIPVVPPDRMLLDLAITESGRPLEKLVGEALHHRIVTKREVIGSLTRYRRHPGTANLRAISPDRAENRRTESKFEEPVLLHLDTLDLPPFVCQRRVYGRSGKRYRCDFVFPDQRTILEADGRAAHIREKTFEEDRARDMDLAGSGWMPLRVTWRQFHRERAAFTRNLLATLSSRTVSSGGRDPSAR
ncbi:MAG: DUF559 domain-containing protein [Solirubrobacteraceae bacterium]|nr:DUF559 domain-containing protein [Solirubrobacteraceae bacterium]